MIGRRRRWRAGVVGVSAVLTLGAVSSGVSARAVAPPTWVPLAQDRGGQSNPNIKPGRNEAAKSLPAPVAGTVNRRWLFFLR